MSGEIYRLTCHVVPMGVTRLSGVPATPRRVYGSAIVLLSGTHLLLPPGFQCFPFIADFRFHVGLNSSDLREHFCWKVRLWLCNSLSRSRGGTDAAPQGKSPKMGLALWLCARWDLSYSTRNPRRRRSDPMPRGSSMASIPQGCSPAPRRASVTLSDSRTDWRRTTPRCGSGS